MATTLHGQLLAECVLPICPTVQQFDHGGAEIDGGLGIRHQGLDISYEQAFPWMCRETDIVKLSLTGYPLFDGRSNAEYSDRSRFDERVEDPDSSYWDRVRTDKDGCIDEASLEVNVDLQ
ncbi:hypothetical protein IW261DRAFT_1428945 [Armillaria novae-zelandiae]|uniref:Uncharacterized protein n=1 Tax=Armillaria novae-zelandiae TaxID=153914 RepID=A0AA39KI59_9AGAR|nr:hypothetical protein IW261DRAFT_1428945 [Armillaria novae-zelandiae]